MADYRKSLRGLAVCCVIAALTVLAAELAFRHLLFSSSAIFSQMRRPELYSDMSCDDYWKLQYLFCSRQAGSQYLDSQLGWVGLGIAPETHDHMMSALVGQRTPVLLYGDSFARCNTPPEDCYQGILNGDERFNRSHYLVNYGVGGYGLDQIYLLSASTVSRYAAPVVIISIFEDDLERSLLSFRTAQKPFFDLERGRLILKGTPIDFDRLRYLSQHPPEISSYLWRLVVQSPWVPSRIRAALGPRNDRQALKHEINSAILDAIIHDLKKRQVRFLFLFCEDLYRTWGDPGWVREFLLTFFRERKVPYVWGTEVLRQVHPRDTFDLRDYVVSPQDPHPNRKYYALLCENIVQWLHTAETQRTAPFLQQSDGERLQE